MFDLFGTRAKAAGEQRAYTNYIELLTELGEAKLREKIAITWAQECLKAINCFVPDHRFTEDLHERITRKMDCMYPDFGEVIQEMYKPLKKKGR